MADGEGEKMEAAGGPELAWVEKQRGGCEADNHWQYRREFLLRNAEAAAFLAPGDKGGQAGDSAALRRLVSFSMVWANHVFLGCRYPPQVMEKVMDMAAGITVTNAPAHTLRDELVAKVKRRISSSNEGLEEPCKKQAMAMDKVPEVNSNSKKATSTEILVKKDVEPVKTSGKKATGNPEKPLDSSVTQKVAPVSALPAAQKVAPAVSSPVAQKVTPAVSSPVAQKVAPAASSPVAQKVAPASALPAAQKVAPAVSSPVAQKVTPAVSSPVAQKVAPAASSPVAQKVAPASALPAAQKVAPAVSSPVAQKVAPAVSSPVAQKMAPAVSSSVAQKVAPAVSSPVAQKVAPLLSSTGVRIEGVAAHYETTATDTHKSVLASLPSSKSKMNFCSTKHSETKSENVLLPEKKVSSEGITVLASKSTSQTGALPPKVPCKLLTNEDAKERQPFFNRLYKAVAWKLVAAGGFSASVNHVELLNSSIQSVKATLDVEFVPLKELADLPQNKSSQENMVCELRCKSVYLGTGCGKSKENAKAVASREALKLFLKKKVIVKLCKRKYKGKEIEDLVLLDEESKPLNLPPALRNPQEIIAKL